MTRCENCGTTLGEIVRSSAAKATVCADCHNRAIPNTGISNADNNDTGNTNTETLTTNHPAPVQDSRSLNRRSSFLVSPRGGAECEVPEMEQLLELHKRGRIVPEEVPLPPLPENAPPVAREVAEFFALVKGLRLWAGDDRPVPFACSWIGQKLEIPKATAHRARKRLVDDGVLAQAGTLPARGKRATELYAPASAADDVVVPLRRVS